MVPSPMRIRLGSGLLAALSTRNFHGPEGEYRWTRERSSVLFHDPGPGVQLRVEAELSSFRPRGQPPPLVVIQAGAQRIRIQPSRVPQTVTFTTTSRGWWASPVEVQFQSETFSPGELDRRALGVRVHEVRLVPEPLPAVLRLAPGRQLVSSGLSVLLVFLLLLRHGCSRREALGVASVAALGWGVGFASFRPYATLSSSAVLAALGLLSVLDRLFPSALTVLSELSGATLHAMLRGLRATADRRSLAMALAGAAGVAAAYLRRPSLEIDLGTGRETTMVEGFAGFDADQAGVNFRRALRGAAIDLSDFGGGSTWKIEVTASLAGHPRTLALAHAGGKSLGAELGPGWSTHCLETRAPFGWRSGVRVELPAASEAIDLRVDRLRIDRGRSLPSLRIVVLVVGSALLLMAAFRAGGVGAPGSWAAAAASLVLQTLALAIDPVLALPSAPRFFVATSAGVLVASFGHGFLSVASRRTNLPPPVPASLAGAAAGFIAWFSATSFPLYQGGHFVFHSSIAEEIWNGKFLLYYLPYPGSMLSHQAQWGNVLVPHSCLFHTLMSPLAALPRSWFYSLEKGALALMLASMALAASALATRAGSRRSGAYAGVLAASLPASFQLLSLGHLMTIFGCWAATMALSFTILQFEVMRKSFVWWWATGLFVLCFLSYTASLLFTLVLLALAMGLLLARSRAPVLALATAVSTALSVAFLAYYVHWAWPFLRESIPALLSGGGYEGSGLDLGSRLAAVPGKLAYTYGHPLLPLVGLAGLGLARPFAPRVMLLCWGSILVLFSGLDLFFNFLLKHHYFVMPVVSVGGGLAADWLSRRGRWGKALAIVGLFSVIGLGSVAALATAGLAGGGGP
jgi:hypothetical protein